MIEITDKSKCSGCSACYSICPKNCISMIEDEEGFLYPNVNKDDCIKCGLCEKVCPLNENNNKKYGVLESCIIQNKDQDILAESTSGGGFTPIAKYVIEQGGVIFGVEMSNEDFFVKHTKIENVADLRKYRSSKYVQSYVGNSFKEAKEELDKKRLVCFSGTPCQIQGFKNYLRKDYENLITVDVVCRGVPSPGVWKKYCGYLKIKGKLDNIIFRNKDLGYQYSTMKVQYKDGRIERNGIESDQWLRMFFSGMILRPSCPTCNFRSVERYSDFTIWDCFNVSDITSELDETKGATRILIHSQKALDIFQKIRGDFYVINAPVEIVSKGISDTAILNKRKAEFIRDYVKMDMETLLNKWFPMSVEVKIKKYSRRILNILGIDLYIKKMKRKIGR